MPVLSAASAPVAAAPSPSVVDDGDDDDFSLPNDASEVIADDEEDSDAEFTPAPKKLLGVDEGEGKGMGAVKPFIGAIVEPSSAPRANPSAPDRSLTLDWAYGYRSFDSYSNITTNKRGHIIYPLAGLVIVYNKFNHTQTFFRGHNDDVRCLARNPADHDWMVSGQNATIINGRSASPHICIWNSADVNEWFKIDLPAGARAVRAVSFSPDGHFVAAVANDDYHHVYVYDVESRQLVASHKGDTRPIILVRWNHIRPSDVSYEFATVGSLHAYFWTFNATSRSLKGKRMALGGKFPMVSYHGLTFSEHGHACLGAHNGTMVVCRQGSGAASKAVSVGGGVKKLKLFTLDTYAGGVVAGLSNKTVVILDERMNTVKTFSFEAKVVAVHVRNKDLYVGTKDGEIFELKSAFDPKQNGGSVAAFFKPLVCGHSDGELWALTPNKDGTLAYSAGEDNKIMRWDLVNHRCTAIGIINEKRGTAPKVKKASTTSLHPQNQCARAIALSADGAHLAIGTNDGSLGIYSAADLTLINRYDLNDLGSRRVTNQEGNWIQSIEYSPDGRLLAVGTHGSVIVIMDVAANYQVQSVLTTHHSFITHMDWSTDGTLLRSNDGAYELLFHDLSDPKSPAHVSSASSVKDTDWATSHCILSWECVGVVGQDGNFINTADRSPDRGLLATGNDDGMVSLWRFPASGKAHQCLDFEAHSSHVASTRFTPDGTFLLTAGGHDLGLLQWKVDAPSAEEQQAAIGGGGGGGGGFTL